MSEYYIFDGEYYAYISLEEIMEENGLVKGGWVKSNERLPENEGVYLGVDQDGERRLVHYHAFHKKFSTNDYISHWQSLPPPSSEDTTPIYIPDKLGKINITPEELGRSKKPPSEEAEVKEEKDPEYWDQLKNYDDMITGPDLHKYTEQLIKRLKAELKLEEK